MIFLRTLCALFLLQISVVGCLRPFSVLIPIEAEDDLVQLTAFVQKKVNGIIAQELSAVAKKKRVTYKEPVVRAHTDHHVTLLYDPTVDRKYEQAGVVALQLMQAIGKGFLASTRVIITPQADLFGMHEEYFTMTIADEAQELTQLRSDIQQALLYADRYVAAPDYDNSWFGPVYRLGSWVKSFFVPTYAQRRMFNYASWNKYAFTPHVTLATLPRREIFKISSWHKADGKVVWESIKKRVRAELFPEIQRRWTDHPLVIRSFQVTGKDHQVLQQFSCDHVVTDKKVTLNPDNI